MATVVDCLQSRTGRTPFLYPTLKYSFIRTSVALTKRPELFPSFFPATQESVTLTWPQIKRIIIIITIKNNINWLISIARASSFTHAAFLRHEIRGQGASLPKFITIDRSIFVTMADFLSGNVHMMARILGCQINYNLRHRDVMYRNCFSS